MADITKKLRAVAVTVTAPEGEYPEYYEIGMPLTRWGTYQLVADIKWGITPGMHADMNTVQVITDQSGLFAEFPFHNVVGVYYWPEPAEPVIKCDVCKDADNTFEKCAACGNDGLPF
jgi:hypothetical protein